MKPLVSLTRKTRPADQEKRWTAKRGKKGQMTERRRYWGVAGGPLIRRAIRARWDEEMEIENDG